MKTLKMHINTTCISFTLNIIIVLIFELIGFSGQLNNSVIWVVFALHALLSLVQYLLGKIFRNALGSSMVFDCAVVIVIVLTFGYFTNLIGHSLSYYLITAAMAVFIYLTVAWVIYTKDQSDATQINKKLRERNHE